MTKYYLIAPAAIALALSACSKEDTPMPDLASHTYAGKSLTVTYCGDEMPAKQVVFTPSDSKDSQLKANLYMSGILDLSSLGIEDIPPLPAPGVLPGNSSTSLDITLLPRKKDGAYTFSGKAETEYVIYSYTGSLTDDHLTVNLEDVLLKNTDLAGKVLKPTPVNATLTDLKNPENITSPFYIDWEIGNIPGLQINPGILVNALTLAPIIPVYHNTAYSSLAQIFDQAVQTMALLDNGNIPVRYYSSKEGATQLMTTNPNMLQYIVTSQNSLQVYINPLSAVGMWLVQQSKPTWLPSFLDYDYANTIKDQIANSSPSDDNEADEAIKNALIQSLLLAIKPAMTDGLPMLFAPTADGINLYLDTKACTDFIGLLLTEITKQPVLTQRLSEYLTQVGLSEQEVDSLIQHIPAILQATTRLNIGLSLKNAK